MGHAEHLSSNIGWVNGSIDLFKLPHSLVATIEEFWERRESNTVLLGEERECNLCAMPLPPSYVFLFV